MQKAPYDIVVFLVVVSAIILCMVTFVAIIMMAYRRNQNKFVQAIEEMRLDHEKTLLSTRLEMQEQTFHHISREIHDNISLSLTLAKLYLNTLNLDDKEKSEEKVEASIDFLTKSIAELSDISKGLNADIIIQQGLLKAVEEELLRIRRAELFAVEYELTGSPAYMDSQKELIVFRIIQEAFNNIIKHARAAKATLILNYTATTLDIEISDDGIGFDPLFISNNREAGLKNMETRVKLLEGCMKIKSRPGRGTSLIFNIPLKENESK